MWKPSTLWIEYEWFGDQTQAYAIQAVVWRKYKKLLTTAIY